MCAVVLPEIPAMSYFNCYDDDDDDDDVAVCFYLLCCDSFSDLYTQCAVYFNVVILSHEVFITPITRDMVGPSRVSNSCNFL